MNLGRSSKESNRDRVAATAAWARQSGGDKFSVIFNGDVFQNEWWVEAEHCPGNVGKDDPNVNPWRNKNPATPEEIEMYGNPTSCDGDGGGDPGDDTGLLKKDPQTEATYAAHGFKPDGSGVNLSYTSARVANAVYNLYETVSNKPKLSAYITDWAQYDGRLDGNNYDPANCGRGFDLTKIDPTAYDRLIFSFLGICGDQGPKSALIDAVKVGWNSQVNANDKIGDGHIVILDPWGDLASFRNVGLTAGNFDCTVNNFLKYYRQDVAAGLLGGLRELQKRAASANHPLELAFSIGGWTLSGYFSVVAADAAKRKIFIDSVIDFFVRFPMFTTVDIDWEYPGGSGLGGNEFSEDDGKNYALLIGELRTALDKQFPSARKRITTAAGADVAKLERADIPGLIAAGLDSVFLMTYDYFGTGWAEAIAHHTNLHSSPIGPYSIEAAVDYLVNQGVSPDKLNIGYANYGRAAAKADLHTREYDRQGNALGSYENGSPEFYDTLNNYLDLEQGTAQGKNGFTLMTDTGADADILFNEQTGHYISTDTPRTVKAKGEYALQKGLGGVFSWSADQDDGLLANAAREGMGYQVTKTVFDMSSVYNPGEKFELGK